MTPEFVATIGKYTIETVLYLTTPILGVALVIGLIISVFQAATQIQEMTLTFVPKILAVFIGLLVFLPWMLETIVSYTRDIITNIPNYVG